MSSYTQPPPGYGATTTSSSADAKKQRAGGYSSLPQDEGRASTSAARPANVYDENDDDLLERGGDEPPPKYTGPVLDAEPAIRASFLRKVYSILTLQILLTTVVSAVLSMQAGMSVWVAQNQWAMLVPLIGSIVTMVFIFLYRHSHPLNLILLTLFTLFESFAIGVITSYADTRIVLQALIITLFTFIGLTGFALMTADKFDFSKLGPWLFTAIMFLLGASLVQLFVPYSKTTDLVFASAGALVFALYILYDTYMIMKRLAADEWVMAVLSLYIDIISLFNNILRILQGANSD